MENKYEQKNKYIFFINIDEQAIKIYERSYQNDKYEIIRKESIIIAKKEFEKKISDDILNFTLNLILKYNIEEPMIIDLSNEIDNIIYEFEENWEEYIEKNHVSILKLKKEIEKEIANVKRKRLDIKKIARFSYFFQSNS